VNGLVTGLLMLATFALTAGAIYLMRRGGDRKRAILMLVAALVMFANVLIMTV